MPTTTTQPSSAPERADWGRLARAALDAQPELRKVLEDLRLYGDLDAELDRCCPPLYVSGPPNRELRRRHGAYYDAAEVRRFLTFCRKLRHIKGKWAGRALVPDLWQIIYVLGPVFGWRREDGNRLFRELYLEVPRKNGKSTLSAAIALYLLMADSNLKAGRLAEAGAEVYSAATTIRQAQEVFRPAEAMARRSPAIAARLFVKTDKALIYEANFSRYEVLSGDPAKAEEKMGMNVSGAVIDELHVHKDRRQVDTIETGTVAREQPLMVFITTAGDDTQGTIYDEKRNFAEAVAKGEIPEALTWAAIYTIPESDRPRWDQLDVVAKANPGMGISVSIDYIEDQLVKARRSEDKKLSFCRLHLNVRASKVSRWLSIDDWDRSGVQFIRRTAEHEMFKGKVAYAGLDLSSAVDLTAIGVIIPSREKDPETKEWVEYLDVVIRAWTPLDRLDKRTKLEETLFRKWIADGHLIGSPGDVIDYDDVEGEAFRLADWLELKAMNFDRWGSKQLIQHMRDGGLNVFELGQGYASMSAPMKETERLVLERRLRHDGNPLLRYAVQNLAVVKDSNENIKPDRDHSTGRIDPFVATVMGIDGWMRSIEEPKKSKEVVSW